MHACVRQSISPAPRDIDLIMREVFALLAGSPACLLNPGTKKSVLFKVSNNIKRILQGHLKIYKHPGDTCENRVSIMLRPFSESHFFVGQIATAVALPTFTPKMSDCFPERRRNFSENLLSAPEDFYVSMKEVSTPTL